MLVMATQRPDRSAPHAYLALQAFLLSAWLACSAAGCALRSEPSPQVDAESASLAKAESPPLAALRKLIRTVTLELEVESVAGARKQAEALVGGAGGFVEALESTHYGAGLSLSVILRVPQEKLEGVLAQARKLGTVTHESQRVEDVTRKYVDTDARLRNLQRTEQRLLGLLEKQASALADVLAVERELNRVREESEVIDAELRTLKEQVSLSTLKLTLVQEPDAADPPSIWTPWRRLGRNVGNILAESLAALMGFGATLVTGFLYLLPWSPLLALAWLFLRFLVGRRRRSRGGAPHA
jgi:Ca-activated chloride channel homolog